MLVKICGLRTSAEVELALEQNVEFYGIIFHKKSLRYVSPEKAASFPVGRAQKVGVFTTSKIEEILQITKLAKLDFVQLHGFQSREIALSIGRERIIRVLWPENYNSLQQLETEAEKYVDSCAYYLLDAGRAGGGSGQSLNWPLLGKLSLPRPWFLAGGLKSENIANAINLARPDGVDLNSGLEDIAGKKSPEKIRDALCEIRKTCSSQ